LNNFRGRNIKQEKGNRRSEEYYSIEKAALNNIDNFVDSIL